MRTERPTCRECACSKVCEYFHFENERNLDERCALENWENYFVPKQEWISVDERLPTYKDGKVLIYTAYGISIAERTVNNRWRGDCAIPKLITHWMPLPEAPKMKGGAE